MPASCSARDRRAERVERVVAARSAAPARRSRACCSPSSCAGPCSTRCRSSTKAWIGSSSIAVTPSRCRCSIIAGAAQAAEGAAQIRRHVLALLRQAFDVRLVDDGVFPGDAAGAARSPQVKASSTTTDFGMPRALSRRSNDRSARALPSAIAEMRIAPDQAAGEPLGIGIEQQLVRIEAVAVLRLVRPVHAVAVELARRDVGQIAVPDIVGALRQRDALELARALAVEQAELDLRRIGGEQREVGAAAVPGRAERMRRPGGQSHAQRFRNEKDGSKRRNDKAELRAVEPSSQRRDRAGVPDIAAAIDARHRC